MNRVLQLNEKDNVAVALTFIPAGERVRVSGYEICLQEAIKAGHKFALADIRAGTDIIKYGFPIGTATVPIQRGQWVHSHNLHSKLESFQEYSYRPLASVVPPEEEAIFFPGFRRNDGQVGVRNEIWIIPTVGCVNQLAENLARLAQERLGDVPGVDGFYALKHPYGCSQLGEDHRNTQRLLASLCLHPNAGGVLVLGLGCENNNVQEFREVVGQRDNQRIKFLVAQEAEDELARGLTSLKELAEYASLFRREPCSVSELKIGLKCGGSDAFSGITANPLVGKVADRLVACGGTAVLTEVPEMFGAETILMGRARDQGVFQQIVELINDWKKYYLDHGQPVYENPSPGNKEGGITTLEEKSLGCVQKGGTAPVVDVLAYGERCKKKGLNLLSAPGNDLVSSTALAAAGCQFILFTTGRGTPLGTCVPTLKISSNSQLYQSKKAWIDFDAGVLLTGKTLDQLTEELWKLIMAVAAGRKRACNEEMGSREIAIFKTGVTL
ncbi:MAG: altronate dehydratase [Thermoanaerobacteraceae bacterium]|nr:altronate dehydratase [Thermoanaerobacteraceae bacterium]